MAVGLEAEGFDFGDSLDALAVQLVFNWQYGLLTLMLPWWLAAGEGLVDESGER